MTMTHECPECGGTCRNGGNDMHPEMKKLVVRAKEMGIPNNLELAMYLINLENRIKELQEHLESQIDRVAYHHERHVERHEKRKYNKR